MNILVVEDDADLRVEIVEYLERRHHRVTACGTVAAARKAFGEMADKALIEAAVCDVSLPMAMAWTSMSSAPGGFPAAVGS